ncbi:MAG: N-acetyl-gamma-glutamyl-phosphate reductase [Eubacterium sp.]|nr:N-acetyl-gamma-glutamyl-phosphate reductase [Eubacterium sp.]
MIKVGIIGSTGYAGQELVRLLLPRKDVEIVWYGSHSYVGQNYSDVYGNMFRIVDAKCLDDDLDALADEVDLIFTATPQGYLAGVLTEEILSKTKVIDLSADFRLKNVETYQEWYKIEHKSPQFLKEAVYGLCEVNRDSINDKVRLIANPGCYTTTSILSLYPLVKQGMLDLSSIIIDAKSGTSGAGRGAKLPNLFCEVNESIKPYGVTTHRHTPEIEEQLGYAVYSIVEGEAAYSNNSVSKKFEEEGQPGGYPITINFTPHLVPMNRGILATCYASLMPGYKASDVAEAFHMEYDKEYFIRFKGQGVFPETRWVEGSNFMDIGFTVDERTGRVIVVGAIDNVVKGAAGQAVQNMNLLFGLEENEGLTMPPLFP